MSEMGPGPSPEEMGIEPEASPEEASREQERKLIFDVVRQYELPPEYLEELSTMDLEDMIATASLWIQEEGHDLDEFLAKITVGE